MWDTLIVQLPGSMQPDASTTSPSLQCDVNFAIWQYVQEELGCTTQYPLQKITQGVDLSRAQTALHMRDHPSSLCACDPCALVTFVRFAKS